MKNFKGLVSVATAAVMLAGSSMPALAAGTNEGGASGDGAYEGFVEETSVFSVLVPTDASSTQGFDFFVDPNGLLEKTNYDRIDGATAADFETGATLFFTRTAKAADADAGTPAVVKYGKDSESIEFKNYSSYDVNVEVSASVSGATGITLSSTAITADDDLTDPTLYLAIVSGSETKVVTADGGKFTGTIAGEPENFEPKYDKDAEKYIYGLKGETTEAAPTKPWKTVSFNLTGACGGTWTAEQAMVAPTITLTWKVTDPKAEAAPTIPVQTYNYDRTTTLDITTNFGGGDLAATSIKKVEGSNDGKTIAGDFTSMCTISGNKITFKNGQFPGASVGQKRYLIVTFDEGTKVTVTLNITK